jgi:Flp pilus assembly protein CpaB
VGLPEIHFLPGRNTLKKHPRTTEVRAGAVNAATVFAVTMAILAGLIFAWVFKVVLLAPKEPPKPPPSYQVTVMASNLRDKMVIQPSQVKTITLSEPDYNKLINNPKYKGRQMLRGQQPVFRTTKTPLQAEEPVFDDQLEPFAYTAALSTRIAPGMRAVNLRLAPEHCDGGLIRVGDRVDVLCTMTNANPVLAGGSTATAPIAKNVKVIARNDTTEIYDAGGRSSDGLKAYTLQTTPFRAALIDLARKMEAEFTLVTSTSTNKDEGEASAGNGGGEPTDPDVSVVSTAHLAALFGVTPPEPEKPDWLIEHLVGTKRVGYQTLPAGSQRPAKNGGTKQAPPTPKGRGGNTSMMYPTRNAALAALSKGSEPDFGFTRPSEQTGGCKYCGKKKK